MSAFRKIYNVLSSKTLLLWLGGAWLLYYISSAIWMKEAFASFIANLGGNILIQIPFVIFLLSGWLNFIRVFGDRFRSGKISFASWLLISCGALLYLSGLFLSVNTRQAGSFLAGEGDVITVPWADEDFQASRVRPGLKERLDMPDSGIFLDYEPRITLTDVSQKSHDVGAYPPSKINGTYFHILNLGIAPGIKFYEKGMLVSEGYMPLRLLPAGNSDTFVIEGYPYKFVAALMPSGHRGEGQSAVPLFSLKSPNYATRVYKGENVIAESAGGAEIRFDGFTLRYSEPDYWILLEASKDPAMPLMKYGIFILAFGIPLYMLRLFLSLFSFRDRAT
ncbi:MAG: hypothetical protein HY809_09215 [Nitrospirae bacterium]|nr:hypothetical protein [Nitrospirota bacterium]